MAPKVISFINYKGGVAKSTSTYHLGCWLAHAEQKRVLLIDIDPQTNLTFLCVPPGRWERRKRSTGTIRGLYRRYVERTTPLDAARFVWKTPIRLSDGTPHPRLDLVPCDVDLIGEDLGSAVLGGTFPTMELLKQTAQEFVRDRTFLKKVIAEVGEDYDYVLIDCPPNLYLMTHNALVASDHYIVTAIPDHLSTIGLEILASKVERIGDLMRNACSLAGLPDATHGVATFGAVLFVRVRIGGQVVTNAHQGRMETIRQQMRCFSAHTTELIGYTEAAMNSVPVWFHDSDNARRARQKAEYPQVAAELLRMF